MIKNKIIVVVISKTTKATITILEQKPSANIRLEVMTVLSSSPIICLVSKSIDNILMFPKLKSSSVDQIIKK
jgi:hypothetical protein